MIPESLITKVKKESESIHEVSWYLNEYKDLDEHPFEKYIKDLYLDFNITLPAFLPENSKQLILGLTILVCDHELHQDSLPGTYKLFVENDSYLNEVRNAAEFEAATLSVLINNYYCANENNEIEKLEDALKNTVLKWNWSGFVKQEEVISLVNQYSLEEASNKADVPEHEIPRILDDYYSRINRKRIANLDSFLNKSNELISAYKKSKHHTQFFSKIIEEVKNGGANLKSVEDINPHYLGIKFN